jgi:CheY-like chemotaxis protein
VGSRESAPPETRGKISPAEPKIVAALEDALEAMRSGELVGRQFTGRTVVDDNRDAAISLAGMLKLIGREVVTAHDGIEALAAADEFRPEVIFTDAGMPRLNGHEATRRIREQVWAETVTIIADTGWGQECDGLLWRDAGCDGHLVKPVTLPELERLLASLSRSTGRPQASN